MIDGSNVTSYLSEHIKKISELSGVDLFTVEQVLNTELATTMGDLALKGKSDSYLGRFSFDKKSNQVLFEGSSLVKDLANGTLDPRFVLKEILENV